MVRRVVDDHGAIVFQPEVKERLANQGVEVASSTPEQLNAVVRAERKLWSNVIKAAGIKIQ